MSAPARRLELGRVGEAVRRVDAIPKVTGEFAYASDLFAAGMLYGHTLRSPHAAAHIKRIDTSEARGMPGVRAVLTHTDVPGEKRYGLEFADQPVLAIDDVRYFGEPVAVVAAEHPEQARRAAARIRVDYVPQQPLVDPERASDVLRGLTIRHGDPDTRGDVSVGGVYGGREDLSMQIHGALLALKTNRPVKMVYSREESFAGHVHRHPAKIWAEHRADRDGKLACVRMRILLDGGAYASSSTAVCSNAVSFACGPYAVPNALIEAKCVYSNNPPCGAMRG